MKFIFQNSKRKQSGISLIELMIALSIGLIALAAMGSMAVFTARSFVATGNYADLDRASRNALDRITRDIRRARAVSTYAPSKLNLVNHDGQPLVLEWKADTGNFTRTESNVTTVLLKQCDFLYFTNYIRVPTNGWQWYKVSGSNNSTTKLIDVNWKCSRQILGQKVNTESVQTAKIVIRN